MKQINIVGSTRNFGKALSVPGCCKFAPSLLLIANAGSTGHCAGGAGQPAS